MSSPLKYKFKDLFGIIQEIRYILALVSSYSVEMAVIPFSRFFFCRINSEKKREQTERLVREGLGKSC